MGLQTTTEISNLSWSLFGQSMPHRILSWDVIMTN